MNAKGMTYIFLSLALIKLEKRIKDVQEMFSYMSKQFRKQYEDLFKQSYWTYFKCPVSKQFPFLFFGVLQNGLNNIV